MSFSFATCDRGRALGFLQKLYPSAKVEDTPESAGPLLDIVEKDYVRVEDPDFHQPARIITGNNYMGIDTDEAIGICREFHDRHTQPVAKDTSPPSATVPS